MDATTKHTAFFFMDAYSRYNQIWMYDFNKKNTIFMTNRGLFCYKLMPFGLKNANAIYQEKYGMKLNPNKCVFKVGSRKFLGFMVNQRGIKANPEKIKALIVMKPLRTIKK